MGVFAGPEIVEDGLVLALDAANPKNYNLTAVEVLVVAGGGAGGYGEGNQNGGGGGGGGAGGLIYNSNFAVTPGSALTVTVGGGGAVVANSGTTGGNGGNSVFGSLTAIGGGGGGGGDFEGTNAGATGGSGGGAGGDGTYGPTIFSAGTSGQGFAGGARNGTTNRAAAGGGGAGGAGSSGTPGANNTGTGGSGGPGLGFDISGTFTFYAGGGGGGASLNFSSGVVNSTGGIGGGGAGGGATGPSNGTANTGGGGGGGFGGNAGAGGSGIVIVRYPGYQRAIGGTVSSVGGYTIHTFTTVETTSFTPLAATNDSTIFGLSDFSGNNKFLTSANEPRYTNSNLGGINFDGSNEKLSLSASYASPSLPIGSSPRTLIACFKPTTLGGYRHVIHYGSNSIDQAYGIALLDNYINNHTWGGNSYFTNFGVITNQIYWVAVTYNDSSSPRNTFFVNGTFGTTGYGQGKTADYTLNTGTSYDLVFGSRIADTEYFVGDIYFTQIYNRALTASEIQQNFNATRSRFGI